MKSEDYFLFFSFFVLIVVMAFTLTAIKSFNPIVDTCNDEFKLIEDCKCLPCDLKMTKYFIERENLDFCPIGADKNE